MMLSADETIWDYFTQLDEVHYQCNQCKKKIYYNSVLALIFHVCNTDNGTDKKD